jgi:hypothetical protein
LFSLALRPSVRPDGAFSNHPNNADPLQSDVRPGRRRARGGLAASALDPEPISAAQILQRSLWTPLSQFADFARLTELQSTAQREYNARVTPEGTLEGL